MDLKKIDLDKLQDYTFSGNEIAMSTMAFNKEFINIKCLDNESIVPTVKAIPLDKVKQAREEIDFLRQHRAKFITSDNKVCIDSKAVLEIFDKLIAESEGVEDES